MNEPRAELILPTDELVLQSARRLEDLSRENLRASLKKAGATGLILTGTVLADVLSATNGLISFFVATVPTWTLSTQAIDHALLWNNQKSTARELRALDERRVKQSLGEIPLEVETQIRLAHVQSILKQKPRDTAIQIMDLIGYNAQSNVLSPIHDDHCDMRAVLISEADERDKVNTHEMDTISCHYSYQFGDRVKVIGLPELVISNGVELTSLNPSGKRRIKQKRYAAWNDADSEFKAVSERYDRPELRATRIIAAYQKVDQMATRDEFKDSHATVIRNPYVVILATDTKPPYLKREQNNPYITKTITFAFSARALQDMTMPQDN